MITNMLKTARPAWSLYQPSLLALPSQEFGNFATYKHNRRVKRHRQAKILNESSYNKAQGNF
jgi:hypothetical protein